MANQDPKRFTYFLIEGEIELNEVDLIDKITGTVRSVPVLQTKLFLLDGAEGRLSAWYNAPGLYKFLK